METLFQEWWLLTVATYSFIWPAIPFAVAFGLWRGLRRGLRGCGGQGKNPSLRRRR